MDFDSLYQRWAVHAARCIQPTADSFRIFAIDCYCDSDRITCGLSPEEIEYIVEHHTDYFVVQP